MELETDLGNAFPIDTLEKCMKMSLKRCNVSYIYAIIIQTVLYSCEIKKNAVNFQDANQENLLHFL